MAERRINLADTDGRFDDVMREFEHSDDTVILEGHDRNFVIITFEQYRELEAQARELRLSRAREAWTSIQQRDGDRNPDLKESEADELANRFADEFAADLLSEGKIRYTDE